MTNIAFTLTSIMGNDAEPFTTQDLIGLLLTCIGFITYSGFGFAHNFLVAQGPPGQMAYAHFEDHNEIIISPEIGTNPFQLIDLINGSLIRDHLQTVTSHSLKDEESQDEKNEKSQLIKSQEIQKITSSSLSSHEIQLKTLNILRNTIRVLEQQMSTSSTSSSRAVNDSSSHDDEIIKEMIWKYNQLFQGDPIHSSSSSPPTSAVTRSPLEVHSTYGT